MTDTSSPDAPSGSPETAPVFARYWLNSELTPAAMGDFSTRIDEYAGVTQAQSRFAFSAAAEPLRRPRGELWSLLGRRRSQRTFDAAPLTPDDIAAALSGCAVVDGSRRGYPSAGAAYPLEIMVLVDRCTEPRWQRRVLHYDPTAHALTPVAELPEYAEYADLINLTLAGAAPAMVLVLLAVAPRTTLKYGERGGRFLLLEAGHAAQNVMLACAERRLACCETGGLIDAGLLRLMAIPAAHASVVTGMAVGRAPRGR